MPKASKKKAKKVVMKVKGKRPAAKPLAATSVRSNSKYNLLVTFNSNHSESAETEIESVLAKIGEETRMAATLADGIYMLSVSDGRKVTERLRKLCEADPKMFDETYRYIPIDTWCKSEIRIMQSRIKKVVPEIEENDKWRLSLNKRFWDRMTDMELILKLTEVIEKKQHRP